MKSFVSASYSIRAIEWCLNHGDPSKRTTLYFHEHLRVAVMAIELMNVSRL